MSVHENTNEGRRFLIYLKDYFLQKNILRKKDISTRNWLTDKFFKIEPQKLVNRPNEQIHPFRVPVHEKMKQIYFLNKTFKVNQSQRCLNT